MGSASHFRGMLLPLLPLLLSSQAPQLLNPPSHSPPWAPSSVPRAGSRRSPAERAASRLLGERWRNLRGCSQPSCREPCSSAGLPLLRGGGRCPEKPGDAESVHGEAKLCGNKTREAVWKRETEPASGHAASDGDAKRNGLQTGSLKMPKDSSPSPLPFFFSLLVSSIISGWKPGLFLHRNGICRGCGGERINQSLFRMHFCTDVTESGKTCGIPSSSLLLHRYLAWFFSSPLDYLKARRDFEQLPV